MKSPQPAKSRPQRIVHDGRFVRLEPLDAKRHGPDLWRAVAGHDHIWTWMAYGPFADEAAFMAWLETRPALDDPLSFAVVDKASGQAKGIVTLMRIDQPNGAIEIGNILYSPAMQRRPEATEAVYLMARHSIEELGYRRFEWKCDDGNAPSKSAALRFGFAFEGLFRQHMIIKGRNRDTAWFSIVDHEWPARRKAFDAWLAADNFDAQGQQRVSLSSMMGLGSS